MSKYIGRLHNVGIGKESSRGTAVAASYWMPKTDLVVDNVVDTMVNEGSYGRIEDSEGSEVVATRAEGNISGYIEDSSFGLLLLATLGSEAALGAVETGVKDHTFNILNNAQHPTLTIATEDPNATSSSGLRHALSCIDTLEIKMALKQYAMYTATFRGAASATGSNTPAYTAQNKFRPQDALFKLATTQAGLDAASATQIKSFSLKITKNLEDDYVLNSLAAVDRLVKNFQIEGTVELLYTDRTQIDTILVGDVYRAMRFQFINSGVTIGAASNPTLTIDLNRVKYMEVARKISNNDIVMQTLKFKGHYSLTDSAAIQAVLRNTVTSLY